MTTLSPRAPVTLDFEDIFRFPFGTRRWGRIALPPSHSEGLLDVDVYSPVGVVMSTDGIGGRHDVAYLGPMHVAPWWYRWRMIRRIGREAWNDLKASSWGIWPGTKSPTDVVFWRQPVPDFAAIVLRSEHGKEITIHCPIDRVPDCLVRFRTVQAGPTRYLEYVAVER